MSLYLSYGRDQGAPVDLGSFAGGEASVFPISNMPGKYSMMLQNCHVSKRSGISKIPGYVKVNTLSCGVDLKSGYEFKRADGTSILLCAGGGNIFKVVGDTLVAVKTGLDPDAVISFGTQNDTCIAGNGVNALLKSTDGTTWTNLLGSPPATGFLPHAHKGRVWTPERTNKLLATCSALNNIEDYVGAGSGYIDFKFVLNQGDELLDIKSYIDLLVFLFRNNIAIYSGNTPSGASADFKLVQKIEGTGVVASRVAKEFGTDFVLLNDHGVKTLKRIVTSGDLNMGNLSALIDPTLRDEMANASTFGMAYYKPLGWLLVLIKDKVWIYSYTYKAWGRMVGANVKGMFNTSDGRLFLCGTGFLYEYGTGWTFAGTNPTMKWDSAWYRLSKAGQVVYPTVMEIITYPQVPTTLALELQFDMKPTAAGNFSTINTTPIGLVDIDSVMDWNAINPFDETPYNIARIPLFGGGRNMKMIFTNTSDQSVEICNIAMLAKKGAFQ